MPMLCVFLMLVFTALSVGKYTSQPTVELYHEFQRKNGEIYFWSAQELTAFLRAAHIDEITLDYLKQEDVKGSLFLSLTPDYLRDAPNALSVAKLIDIIQLLVTIGLPFLLGNPRIGMLLIPWLAAETQTQFFGYNPAMAYEDNASGWWFRWLQAPQLLVWDYIQPFRDTNYWIVTGMAVALFVGWFSTLAKLPSISFPTQQLFSSFLMLAVQWMLWPVVPWFVVDLIFVPWLFLQSVVPLFGLAFGVAAALWPGKPKDV